MRILHKKLYTKLMQMIKFIVLEKFCTKIYKKFGVSNINLTQIFIQYAKIKKRKYYDKPKTIH